VFCVCVLAELCIEGGHAEEGLVLLAAISAEDREGFYGPEIHRLEGELRRRLPSPDMGEIESCFQAALTLARQRAAKSLELRAATSLSRLWRDQGNRAEARDLLTSIYDWFTEGLDLPDLQNARDLIDDVTRPT
jgi:predicted ATPase